jgi:hypothetical protein
MKFTGEKVAYLSPTIRKNALLIFCILLVAFKLWLALSLRLRANGTALADDYLFVTHAQSIIAGEWLGAYDHRTLVKGPFYSVFIALCFYAGVPLLFAQQLLHAFAVGIFAIAIRPIVQSRIWLTICFGLVLFDPYLFSFSAIRVLREGIYPSLTLLVLACSIALIFRTRCEIKHFAFWSVGLGLSLAAFWTTREEGIWLVPTLLIFVGAAFIRVWHERDVFPWKRISLLVLPFALWVSGVVVVAGLNYYTYGIFNTVEFKNKAFKRAVGSIFRVDEQPWRQYVVASKESRQALYEVSPAFKELEMYLEGDIGKNWHTLALRNLKIPVSEGDDILGGWFVWALRDAAAEAGHHATAREAERFYTQIADEINAACESGRIECSAKRASLVPPWRRDYIPIMYKELVEAPTFLRWIIMGINDRPFEVVTFQSEVFEDITRSPLTTYYDESEYLTTQLQLDTVKYDIMWSIALKYTSAYRFVPGISVAVFLFMLVVDLRRKKLAPVMIVSAGLLIAIVARIFVLLYMTVTSFRVISSNYFGPAYAIWIVFFVLTSGYFLIYLWELARKSPKEATSRESADGDSETL